MKQTAIKFYKKISIGVDVDWNEVARSSDRAMLNGVNSKDCVTNAM
jgi:hypothetical protein